MSDIQETKQIIADLNLNCTVDNFAKSVNWYNISKFQKLSEQFIEKHAKSVNWSAISEYQKLSEQFIEKYANSVNWFNISKFQKLSEQFIEKHAKSVNWSNISAYQKLSEQFIEKHAKSVNWSNISKFQKLSEQFIEKHANSVNWSNISAYQKLSEQFIEKHAKSVDWFRIGAYQKLSESFIEKHGLVISASNWNYVDDAIKLPFLIDYEIVDGYVVGYKGIRSDNYSNYNFQYKYEIGGIYEAHCDANIDNENSFGLSVWTLDSAKDYCNQKTIKVRTRISDIKAVVHSGNKIRTQRFEVLDIIES